MTDTIATYENFARASIDLSKKRHEGKKLIAILGANSYIGQQFHAFCTNKYPCYPLYREYDLRDTDRIISKLDFLQPDIVIDFAAENIVADSWKRPTDYYEVNVTSKVRLIEHLRTRPYLKRFIEFSTPEVYGSGSHNEFSSFDPSTPYAASRAAFDMHLLTCHRNYDFPVVITRTANVYGPNQKGFRLVPLVIDRIKKNLPIELHGGGASIRSFIHIDDVCRMLLGSFDYPTGETLHFTTDEFITIKDLVLKIYSIMGKKPDIINVADRPGKDHEYRLLNLKYDYKAKINLDEGLRGVIEN